MWFVFLLLPLPALAIGTLPLWGSPVVQGNFGTRAQADALCLQTIPFECGSVYALVSYPGDLAQNLITQWTEFPITGPTGIPIADNYSALFTGAPFYNSFKTAGVISSYMMWTGADGYTCAGWTQNSTGRVPTGFVGNPTTLGASAWRYGANRCSYAQQFACLCGLTTSAPTPYPVVNPTASPGTFSTEGFIFAVQLAAPIGTIGAHENANDICRTRPEYSGYNGEGSATYFYAENCKGQPIALLCYSGGDDLVSLPQTYGFSAAVPMDIYYPYNDGVITFANWSTFLAEEYPTGPFPTGCDSMGYTGDNCADWTTTTGEFLVSEMGEATCDWQQWIMCVCPPGNTDARVNVMFSVPLNGMPSDEQCEAWPLAQALQCEATKAVLAYDGVPLSAITNPTSGPVYDLLGNILGTTAAEILAIPYGNNPKATLPDYAFRQAYFVTGGPNGTCNNWTSGGIDASVYLYSGYWTDNVEAVRYNYTISCADIAESNSAVLQPYGTIAMTCLCSGVPQEAGLTAQLSVNLFNQGPEACLADFVVDVNTQSWLTAFNGPLVNSSGDQIATGFAQLFAGEATGPICNDAEPCFSVLPANTTGCNGTPIPGIEPFNASFFAGTSSCAAASENPLVHACFILPSDVPPVEPNFTFVYVVEPDYPIAILGDRANANEYCAHGPEYGSHGTTYGYALNCDFVEAILCFNETDDIISMGERYGFASAPVGFIYTPNNNFTNWDFFITQVLGNAPVALGCTPAGTTAQNCNGFTNLTGLITTNYPEAGTTISCDQPIPLFCACVGKRYTSQPTASPSTSEPTASPTVAPLLEPAAAIQLYTVESLTVNALGPQANDSDALCNGGSLPMLCEPGYAFALICSTTKSPLNLPMLYDFSPALGVFGPTQIPFATEWADLWNTTLENTMTQAGITSSFTFSGCDGSGNLNPTYTCEDWTLSDFSHVYTTMDPGSTAPGWFADSGSACGSSGALLCGCRVPTASWSTQGPTPYPTFYVPPPEPTPYPTTVSPSSYPTRYPTPPPTYEPTEE